MREALNQGIDTVQSGEATLVLAANVEVMVATAAIAHGFTGNVLGNHIIGHAGADTLIGGQGSDTLDGGAGGDRLIGGLHGGFRHLDHQCDSPRGRVVPSVGAPAAAWHPPGQPEDPHA